jgi:predicted ferric reductase
MPTAARIGRLRVVTWRLRHVMPRGIRGIFPDVHSLAVRTAWLGTYLFVIVIPLALAWTVGQEQNIGLPRQFATGTGLLAFSLLVVALVLPARVPWLVSSFGIERILRNHRLVALTALVLVAVHLVVVLFTDPRGLAILNLADTTAAAWAAVVSTVALVAAVALALRRKRRQPRYEGWRLLHIALAGVVVAAGWLHAWWLQHLTSDPLAGAWFVLLALAVVALALYRWVWRPWRAHQRSYVVDEVVPVAGDAHTLVVQAHGHGGLPFSPGQFAWLKIGSSSFVFEEHPFTIASTAEQPHRKEFTIKALGDFSELLAGLRPGRRIFLDGPYGRFTTEGLRSDGFVFIAGGVGVTPMLSILRTLADRGDQRPHQLIVGARTMDDLMLRDEIRGLREKLDLIVTEVLESPPPDWPGEAGMVDNHLLDRVLPSHAQHHDYFLCGPPGMVVAVGRLLRERGIPVRRIHTEQFEVV